MEKHINSQGLRGKDNNIMGSHYLVDTRGMVWIRQSLKELDLG